MRKVLLFVATLLLVWSCGKDEISELIPENEFFKVQPDNLDVKIFYDYLKNGNTEEIKSKTDVDIWGIPIWDKEVKYISNNKTMYLIPYVEPDKMEINSILVLGVDPLELQYGMYINDQDYYPTPDFDWVFEYFMQEIFEKSDKYEFIPVNNIEDTNTKAAKLTCNDVYSYAGGYRHYIGRDCFYTIIPNVPFALTDRDGGDGEYGGSFSNPGGGSPSPSPAPPVIEDKSWKDSKADCVKQKLIAEGNNSILNKLLKGFNLSTSTINLTFYVGNTDYRGNPVQNGKCIFDPNTNRMSVYISENRLNASSLEVARTVLHECFHAYMYGKLYESQIHNGLAPEPDFQKDFMNYSNVYGSSGGSNSAQHNYMATMYIQFMKEGLNSFFNSDPQYMEYANNNSSNEHWNLDSMLEGLSWQGLHGTDAWKDFIANYPAKVKDFNLQISLFVGDYNFPNDCD